MTPTTAAGRKMLDEAWQAHEGHWTHEDWEEHIAAIEAEAAGIRVTGDAGLDVERVAAFLHDEYGCRSTCRGGRLADDRHPSHNEAYRGQAERLVAATSRVTGEAGLDVERLARALRAVAYGGYEAEMADPMEVGDLSLNGYAKAGDLAADIAREYAATDETP